MIATILYLGVIIAGILITVFLLLLSVEVGVGLFFGKAPEVPSSTKLRNAVVSEIRARYPDAKTVIDIGSGWGGMTRRIACEFSGASVTGIELMPLSFGCSALAKLFAGPANAKFVIGDAIKFIKNSDGFDVGVCYCGTALMKDIPSLSDKFKLIISLDFPIPNVRPIKIIKLHNDGLGQHVMYVYKN